MARFPRRYGERRGGAIAHRASSSLLTFVTSDTIPKVSERERQLAAAANLPVASRPGLAPDPPSPQFPDARQEGSLPKVQPEKGFDGARLIFVGNRLGSSRAPDDGRLRSASPVRVHPTAVRRVHGPLRSRAARGPAARDITVAKQHHSGVGSVPGWWAAVSGRRLNRLRAAWGSAGERFEPGVRPSDNARAGRRWPLQIHRRGVRVAADAVAASADRRDAAVAGPARRSPRECSGSRR
jgi:hypothetical protein